jgi:hypothetical protein
MGTLAAIYIPFFLPLYILSHIIALSKFDRGSHTNDIAT